MARSKARTLPTALGVLGATAILTLISHPPATGEARQTAPASCEIEELPLPDGGDAARVSGSGPNGKVLLGSAVIDVSPMNQDAVVWRDGQATAIDAEGDMVDMNNDGIGVGHYLDDQSSPHAWIYDGTQARPLAGEATAHAINDGGQIVGERMAPTPNGPPVAVPVTWPSGDEEPVDLAKVTEGTGTANDIAEDGTVVGTFDAKAVLWHPDGTREQLPVPEGVPADASADAVAISGEWVLGHVQVDRKPLRWNLRTGAVQFVKGVEEAHSINSDGWVVGESELRGVLSTGDSVVTLQDLAPQHMYTPVSISSDGTTIGGTAQPRGNPSPVTEVPVRWTCS